jgi:hypothetical protein
MKGRSVVVLAAVAIVGVSGCGGGGGTPRDPIDVAGSSVTLVNWKIEAECFTFDMPTIAEYEMNPDSEECQTAIRWVGGDSLSEIIVRAQVGENDLEFFFATIRESFGSDGKVPVTTETATVAGVRAGVARTTNDWGLAYTFYFVPESTGAFVFDGEPITSFLIAGPSGAPEMEAVLDELVASFRLRN